ncbi:hypothetical protein VIBNISFn118_1300006 [Vibrio nigripulchritudo SFn118]|nr:hypothetical protein VIBNISFn118_1300006 [Vibrio nigripulchritudo SFn118]
MRITHICKGLRFVTLRDSKGGDRRLDFGRFAQADFSVNRESLSFTIFPAVL